MTDSIIKRTEALREEAYRAIQASPQFAAFRALDEAVIAMGGRRHSLNAAPAEEGAASEVAPPTPTKPVAAVAKRVTQPDAAEECLREVGQPVPIAELMKLVEAKGVVFTGTDPVASFGSQLSRNPYRFINRRFDGQSFWWLRGKPWPTSESEAPDLPLEAGSGASSSYSSQEGGDAHAATTVN